VHRQTPWPKKCGGEERKDTEEGVQIGSRKWSEKEGGGGVHLPRADGGYAPGLRTVRVEASEKNGRRKRGAKRERDPGGMGSTEEQEDLAGAEHPHEGL